MEHLDQRRKVAIMISVMASMLFASLNQTIVGTALPRIASKLSGMDYFEWVFTIYMLTTSITAILVGKLSDIYGRKPFILTGIAIFILGSFLCGTADSMIQLIIYRGIQGIGGGMIMSTAFTAVGDLFAPRERGRWQGLMSAVFGLSSVLGPTLGGYIVDHWEWRWIFWIFLPFGLIAFLLIWRLFPSISEQEKVPIDYLGSIFLTLTIMPLLLAFTWAGKTYPWLSVEIIGLFSASLVALAIFIPIERRSPNPVLPLYLFRNRVFTISNLVGFTIGFGMFGAIMYVPFFIQGVSGMSATKSGFIGMPMTLAMVFTSAISGQLISRTGKYKKLALVGLLIMAGGMYSLSLMDTETSTAMAITNMIIVGFGLGIAFPIFTLTIQNAVDHRQLGVATASAQLFRQMGGTVGVAIMSTILATRMENKLGELGTNVAPSAPMDAAVKEQFSGLQNPQLLMDPDKLNQIRADLPEPLTQLFDQMVLILREGLGYALNGVFLTGTIVMVLSLVLTLFLDEIPLRKSNTQKPAEAEREEKKQEKPLKEQIEY